MANYIQGNPETPVILSADFSVETLQAMREWHDIVKVIKEKTYNQSIQQDIIQIEGDI